MSQVITNLPITAVLLDLDGTLVDTAPDMVGTLHELCIEFDLDRCDLSEAKRHVSDGSVALLKLVLSRQQLEQKELWVERFLSRYARRIAKESRLYSGMDECLDWLGDRAIPWGIVTNKPETLSVRLIEALGLSDACACLIGGDTLPRRKPDPAPLLHAASLLGLVRESILYVGDHQRDIDAARAAGMFSAAASWGYIKADDHASRWGADRVLTSPADLLALLHSPASGVAS